MYRQANLVIDYSVRGLCCKPYPNHPKGCPNFRCRKDCPPIVPRIERVFDLNKPMFVIFNIFPFGKHVARMKKAHPDWTDRQLRCCLYWQPRARKQLREAIKKFSMKHTDLHVSTCPEAMGVNITKTMASVGEKLEWPPMNKTYQVAIAGTLKYE